MDRLYAFKMSEASVKAHGYGHVGQCDFIVHASEHHKRKMKEIEDEEGSVGRHLEVQRIVHLLASFQSVDFT
jgi:hypothetical protein